MDSKSACIAKNPTDDFVDALKNAGVDFFLDFRKLLVIGVTFTISFQEVEKGWYQKIKTAFRCTMKDGRDSDLNLIEYI